MMGLLSVSIVDGMTSSGGEPRAGEVGAYWPAV